MRSRLSKVKESEVAQLRPTLLDPMDCVAYQAPPSLGFSRQEYWSGLLFPSPGDLPDPGIKPRSPALQADALPSELPGNWTRWSLKAELWIKLKKKLRIFFFFWGQWKKQGCSVKSQPWQLSCGSLDFGPHVCSLFQPLPHAHDTQAALLGNGSRQLLCVSSRSLDEHTPVLSPSPAVKLPYSLYYYYFFTYFC